MHAKVPKVYCVAVNRVLYTCLLFEHKPHPTSNGLKNKFFVTHDYIHLQRYVNIQYVLIMNHDGIQTSLSWALNEVLVWLIALLWPMSPSCFQKRFFNVIFVRQYHWYVHNHIIPIGIEPDGQFRRMRYLISTHAILHLYDLNDPWKTNAFNSK